MGAALLNAVKFGRSKIATIGFLHVRRVTYQNCCGPISIADDETVTIPAGFWGFYSGNDDSTMVITASLPRHSLIRFRNSSRSGAGTHVEQHGPRWRGRRSALPLPRFFRWACNECGGCYLHIERHVGHVLQGVRGGLVKLGHGSRSTMLQPKGSPNGICPLPWGWLKVIAHYRSSILRIVKESFTKWNGKAGSGKADEGGPTASMGKNSRALKTALLADRFSL